MILTPTSIEVRPAKLTRAYAVTSSPTWIGSRKSTLSTDTVTHGFEAWRIAATAATRSTSDRTTPPNTLRSEEHTSELQSHSDLVCRLLLEKKKINRIKTADVAKADRAALVALLAA